MDFVVPYRQGTILKKSTLDGLPIEVLVASPIGRVLGHGAV